MRYPLVVPPGDKVTITDAHGESFVNVSHVQKRIYYILYETAHDTSDVASLRHEARMVWCVYQPQVMNSEYDSAVVTPFVATSGAGYPFYLERGADGRWLMQ